MKNKKSFWTGGVIVLWYALIGTQPAVAAVTGTDTNLSAPRQSAPQYTDRLIVKRRGVTQGQRFAPSANTLQALAARAGVTLAFARRMSGGADVLRLPHHMTLAEAGEIAKRLQADPDVEYAEPDRIMRPLLAPGIPNDPRYSEQWHYQVPENDKAGRANLPGAWDITTGSAAVVVAVIDTGLAPHIDISGTDGRVLPGYDFVSDPFVANDAEDGRDSNPSDPGDWVSRDEVRVGCPEADSSWHGTHVAGTIGALSDNGIGVAGVNWQSRLLPVRVLGKCGGYLSDIIDGMRWAAGLLVPDAPPNPHPAHVLNLSMGTPGVCSDGLKKAVDDVLAAGKVIVVAAGNDSGDVMKSAPANCAGVIAVAAVNEKGNLAWYSNFGSGVAISAPGGDADTKVLSTSNEGLTSPAGDTYDVHEGTSMAAAHVTGIVSLMLSVNPDLSPLQIAETLKQTARPFPYENGRNCAIAERGAGIVDAAEAVRAVQAALALPVSSPPTADAGMDQTTSPGMTVTLRGTGTTPNGTIDRYQWRQLSGPPVVLCGADGVEATIAPPLPVGTLTFQFTVQDSAGLVSTDSVSITVEKAGGGAGDVLLLTAAVCLLRYRLRRKL